MLRFSTLVACAGVLTHVGAADARVWIARNCDFEVRVKSNAARINSLVIPKGRITSFGTSFTRKNSNPMREARYRAYWAAIKCVRGAIRSTGIPQACRARRPRFAQESGMLRYGIRNLKRVALNALCNRARRLQRRTTIENYEIYLYTNERGDKRRECSRPKGPYETIEKGRNLRCRDGQARGNEEESFSGWYDKSGSAMRVHIRDYCHRRRGGARWQILKYEVNNRGKLRAKFRCF